MLSALSLVEKKRVGMVVVAGGIQPVSFCMVVESSPDCGGPGLCCLRRGLCECCHLVVVDNRFGTAHPMGLDRGVTEFGRHVNHHAWCTPKLIRILVPDVQFVD